MRRLCGSCRFGSVAGTAMVYLFILVVGFELLQSGVIVYYFPWLIRVLATPFASRLSGVMGYIVFAGLFCGLARLLSGYSVRSVGSDLHGISGSCGDWGETCDLRSPKRVGVFVKPLLVLITIVLSLALSGTVLRFDLSPSRRQGALIGAAITAQRNGFTAAALSALDKEISGQFMVQKLTDYYFASGWALDMQDWPSAAELSMRLVYAAAAKANYSAVAVGIVQLEVATQNLLPCSLVNRSVSDAPDYSARQALMYLFSLARQRGVISGANVPLFPSLSHRDNKGFTQAIKFLIHGTPSRLPGSGFSSVSC